jgi:hypothetical protein
VRKALRKLTHQKRARFSRLYVSEARVPLPFPPFSRDFAAALVSALTMKRKSAYVVQDSKFTARSAVTASQGSGDISLAAHAVLQVIVAYVYPRFNHWSFGSSSKLWPDSLHLRPRIWVGLYTKFAERRAPRHLLDLSNDG